MELKTKVYKPYTKEENSIRRDVAFRAVFGNNYRSEYLKALLESLLHKKITNIVIRNDVELDKIHADNKETRLDILAEIDGKEKINVEFQNENEYNVIERGEIYASGIHFNSLKVGDKYVEASKTIVIWLLGYNLFNEKNTYHEIARMRKDSDGEIIGTNIEYHYIELPRFIETVNEIKTPEEQWLAYLSNSLSEEEKGELFKMNRTIEEIDKIVDIVMSDKDVQDAINNRILAENLEYLKKKKAYEDGLRVGEEQGREEKNRIIKQMLKMNLDDETIIKATAVSKDELEKIKADGN